MSGLDGSIFGDGLLNGRVRLAQPAQGYRVAIDPVLLAASVTVSSSQTILDAGCGTGAAALCLAARCADGAIVAIERDPALAEFARRNVSANDFGARIDVIEQDFEVFASAHRETFHQVLFNPPFYASSAHTASPYATKAVAHDEATFSFDGWIAAAATCLRPAGRLTLIHRADRLADILMALDRRFGATLIFPLWPRIGTPAKRIIVSAVKGRKTAPMLLPGLVLHEDDGAFTAKVENILRNAAPLALTG